MLIVIINGVSATGKTTLARHVSDKFGYRVLSKDDIKDKLVKDSHRKPNLRNWRYFDKQSLRQLSTLLKEAVKNNESIIIESNFHKHEQAFLKELAANPEKVELKELDCVSTGKVIRKRFVERSKQDQRAKVHQDWFWYPLTFVVTSSSLLLKHWNPPFAFVRKRLVVDTTNPSSIDYQQIADFISS